MKDYLSRRSNFKRWHWLDDVRCEIDSAATFMAKALTTSEEFPVSIRFRKRLERIGLDIEGGLIAFEKEKRQSDLRRMRAAWKKNRNAG